MLQNVLVDTLHLSCSTTSCEPYAGLEGFPTHHGGAQRTELWPLRLFLEHLGEEPMPFSDKRTEQQLKKLVVVMGSLGLRFAGSRPHLIAASSLSKRERFYLDHPQYDTAYNSPSCHVSTQGLDCH